MPPNSSSLAGIPGASPASPQCRAFRRTSRGQRTSQGPLRGKRRPGVGPQCRAFRRTSYGQRLPPHPLHRPTGNHAHTGRRLVSLCAGSAPVSVQGVATCTSDQVVWAGRHTHWALNFDPVPVRYSCLKVCFATPSRRFEDSRITTLASMQVLGAPRDTNLCDGPLAVRLVVLFLKIFGIGLAAALGPSTRREPLRHTQFQTSASRAFPPESKRPDQILGPHPLHSTRRH